MTNNEIKVVIKNHPTKKISGPDIFMAEFYQIVQEEWLPILKLFQKVEVEKILPNLFSEASTTLIPNSDKNTTKKKPTREYPWWP